MPIASSDESWYYSDSSQPPVSDCYTRYPHQVSMSIMPWMSNQTSLVTKYAGLSTSQMQDLPQAPPTPSETNSSVAVSTSVPTYTSTANRSVHDAHLNDLQHQCSISTLALQTLQREHDRLQAAFSRSQIRCSMLDEKLQVSEHEINFLNEEKARLQAERQEFVEVRGRLMGELEKLRLRCLAAETLLKHQPRKVVSNHVSDQYMSSDSDSDAGVDLAHSRAVAAIPAVSRLLPSIEDNKAPESTPSLCDDTSSDETTTPLFAVRPSEQALADTVASQLVVAWIQHRNLPATIDVASGVSRHANGSGRSGASTALMTYRDSDSSGTGTRGLKRSINRGGDGTEDGDDKSRKRRRKAQEPFLMPGEPGKPGVRLLACPYYKYDPRRYFEHNLEQKEYRGCASSYLMDISRLK